MKSFLKWTLVWLAAITFALLLPLNLHAQDCNALVTLDEAHVFTTAPNATALIDQGADVHVVSTSYTGPLATEEAKLENGCPNWLAAGHRKPNLFVLMVSPTTRKKNVFFGAAYTAPLKDEDTVNLLYSQAANPFFRQGDFSGGASAAFKDFASKVVAFHDQQQHPAVTQVTEQATDLSGFWTFLYWSLAIVGTVLAVWFGVWLLGRARRRREELATAVAGAAKAKDRAIRAYNLKTNPPTVLAQRFLDLTNSVNNDPGTEGLTVTQYEAMTDVWNDFYQDITGGEAKGSRPRRVVPMKTEASYGDKWAEPRGPLAPAYVPPTTSSTTVINNTSSNDDLLTGVLVGEALSDREEPVHHHHSSYDDSSSSGSGSDSSYSSDDSSSSFSSGSDSSFSDSSSSSDFGGSGGGDSSF